MAAHVTSAGEPRRSRNLAESVVSYVKQQIASEALKPGDKLPTESELMVGLGVSRTVVREGISRLQASEAPDTVPRLDHFARLQARNAFANHGAAHAQADHEFRFGGELVAGLEGL